MVCAACGFTGRDSPQDVLATLCVSMSNTMLTLSSAVDEIITLINTMNMRAVAATAQCAADYDALLSALAHARARVLRDYRVRSRAYDKWLDEKVEEADTVSKQLTAVSAMCTTHSMHASVLLHCVGHMSMLTQSMFGDGAILCVPLIILPSSALAGMSTVWHELPDGAVSTVSGRGMMSFVKGAAGVTRNVMFVYPCASSGALAEFVKPDDVCLMLRDGAGSLIDAHVTVERVGDGGLQFSYVVDADCVSKLSVSVFVCDVMIGSVVTVQSEYDAINGTNHVASYDVGIGKKTGMAVNADRSMMAVSYEELHQIHVFRLTPSFERVCVIGRVGTGPAEFYCPRRLCFTDDDTILVCDRGNSRVQQWTVPGEYLRSFTAQMPVSVAVHGDMVAVGTYDGLLEIYLLATGELLRRFGSRGNGPGQIGGYATSIRFTRDGLSLLIAECSNRRLSLFTVDGVFMKHIGADIVDYWSNNDVSFGAGDEIIVADSGNNRICVFSPDGDTLIKTWGSYGTAAGQFEYPIALAVSGSYLYVMDNLKTRVQVFE
jgi:DNA-binding beta-propeller fold protein YncE